MDVNDRFVRWQTILREQLTFINNLFTTISLGVIGYIFSFLADNQLELYGFSKFLFTAGLITVIVSFIVGIITAFNRLQDYRVTFHKIRLEKSGANQDQLDSLKKDKAEHGILTWTLLKLQIATFSLGIISLLVSLFVFYGCYLF